MRIFTILLFVTMALPVTALAQTTYEVGDESELSSVIGSAVAGDIILVTESFTTSSTYQIPTDVTVDGQGFEIATTVNGLFTNGDGTPGNESTGVVIENLKWTNNATNTGGWTLRPRTGGDITIRNSELFNVRLAPWEGGASITVEDSTLTYRIPFFPNSAFTNPMVLWEDSSLTITNTLIDSGYADTAGTIHVDKPMVVGVSGQGSPFTRTLTISGCTIVSPTDGDAGDALSGGPRHLSVIEVEGDPSADDNITVTDTAFIADVSGIFRIRAATPTVSVSNSANLGMIRSPAYLRFGNNPPSWTYNGPISDIDDFQSNNITEANPYVNPLARDFRMIETAASATGSSTGGVIGVDYGTVAASETFQNKDLEHSVASSQLGSGTIEETFNHFDIFSVTTTQLSRVGTALTGNQSMALAVLDSATATGFTAHNNTLSHAAFQTFQVTPGSLVTVSVSARRSVVSASGTTWVDNGQYGTPVIGLANGTVKDPNLAQATAGFTGAENVWETEEVSLVSSGNEVTFFLIHRTNGSYNRSEFDDINVTVGAAPNPASVERYNIYR